MAARFDLRGRVTPVTGAAGGIGAALSLMPVRYWSLIRRAIEA